MFACSVEMMADKPDVLILTETWLCDGIVDAELGLRDYIIYRCDRNIHTSEYTRGGGVLIAVKSSFFSRLIDTSDSSVEQLFIVLHAGSSRIVIGAVYIPPGASVDIYEAHCRSVIDIWSVYTDANFVIAGDYNLPNTSWKHDGRVQCCHRASGNLSQQAELIRDNFNMLNFRQFNEIVNSTGYSLDLVFASMPNLKVELCHDSVISCDHYHPAIIFRISLSRPFTAKTFSNRKLFNIADYAGINDFLASVDWDDVIADLTVEAAVDFVYERLNYAVSAFVPRTQVVKSGYPVWFTGELIGLLKSKKRAHRLYKRSSDYADYLVFSSLRSECKKCSLECWSRYISRAENAIQSSAKSFWRLVNGIRKSSSGTTRVYRGGSLLITDRDIANGFADHFESVYGMRCDRPLGTCVSSVLEVASMEISLKEVYQCIQQLSINCGPGNDELPVLFFKATIFLTSRILWLIFNKSLVTGVFPSKWKQCIVTPIFKSGDKTHVSNYRPICKQNVMAKIFESIVAGKLSKLCKNVIIDEQHGFMSGRSTVSNLAVYSAFVASEIEGGHQVDAVYTDFSKAFDSVDHSILIDKLNLLGVGGIFLRWVSSFLTDRTQFVDFNGTLSRPIDVTSGVPQGSHIGPLLFLLFINDIADIFNHSRFLLYADDLKVFRRIDGFEDAVLLQDDLRSLELWCRQNNLKMNINKCHIIHFHRRVNPYLHDYELGSDRLPSVNTVRDLGIIFSFDLSFKEHIVSVVSAACNTLGFILRWGGHFRVDSIRTLYCALVRSKLEYGSVIWSPYYDNQRLLIERVQHRFLRYVSYRVGLPMEVACHEYATILCRMSMLSLERRRIIAEIIFIYNLFNSIMSCPALLQLLGVNCPRRSLRGGSLMHTHVHSTLYGSNSIVNRTCTRVNRLPASVDMFHLSLARFRSEVTRVVAEL